jgi:AmmeMemoRadiSam system protein B
MIRKPAVAGQFYHAEASRLAGMVEELIPKGQATKEDAKAVLCPHAGLIYSGSVAGAVYAAINPPKTYVLIGPNHTGLGSRVALMAGGRWEIPTGAFSIDEGLAESILSEAPPVAEDAQAHMFEHSLEVQLPFLAQLSKEAKIVPISVMSATLDELKAMGKGIARAVSGAGYPVVIVASSDMSHFVSDREARKKDRLAIDRVLGLDPDGLYTVVREKDISMCGFMPSVIMLSAARALGASHARLVKYTTSAEVSGDYDQVVGYAGIIIK